MKLGCRAPFAGLSDRQVQDMLSVPDENFTNCVKSELLARGFEALEKGPGYGVEIFGGLAGIFCTFVGLHFEVPRSGDPQSLYRLYYRGYRGSLVWKPGQDLNFGANISGLTVMACAWSVADGLGKIRAVQLFNGFRGTKMIVPHDEPVIQARLVEELLKG